MNQYALAQNGSLIRDDGINIPTDESNRDYADYLLWAASGGAVAPYVPATPPPPITATNFQIRAALMQYPAPDGQPGTMFDAVDAAVRGMGGAAVQAWEYANDVDRYGPLVELLAAGLGMDSDRLDELFFVASSISA